MTLIDYISQEKKGEDIQDSVDTSIQRWRLHIKSVKDDWLQYSQHEDQQKKNLDNKNGKKNNSMDISSEISLEKTWTWLRKGNLKRETVSLLIAIKTIP